MNSTILIPIIAVILFALGFISKRRFGLIGLALAAGSVLSTIWQDAASLIVSGLGIVQNGPMTTALTLGVLTLLPGVILLFHGHAHSAKPLRIVSSLLFALVGTAFLIDPLKYAIDSTGSSLDFYNTIHSYKDIIIGVGMVVAILDLFFTKPPKHDKKSKH
jgi:hypothetical protein